MKMKRLLSLVLALCLLATLVPAFALPAEAATNITLRVWADSYALDWTEQRCADFQEAHPEWNITFQFEQMGPQDAGNVLAADPESGADVFCYASDQIGTMVEAGALKALTGSAKTQVVSNNSDATVNTVTYTDGKIYGVPYTVNTWFMYYNKSIFSASDVKSMETMLSKGKVSFPLTNSWYLWSFFAANGCQLFGEKGNEAICGIDLGSEEAVAVVEYLMDLVDHENFQLDDCGSGMYSFLDGETGVYFSGSWDYSSLYQSLGDDLGAVQLPTVKINGKTKQLKAFAGSKAYGVNATTDYPEAAMALAAFLGNKTSQKSRYASLMDVPTIASLATVSPVKDSVVAVAQTNTVNNTSVAQPSIAEMNNYWAYASSLGSMIVNGEFTEGNVEYDLYPLALNMNNGLAIVYQPEDAEAIVGGNAYFYVGYAYIDYPELQWQYRTSSTGSWKNTTLSGNKTSSLKVTATEGRDGYQYRCVATYTGYDGVERKLASRPVTLNVITSGIVTQPVTQKVKSGETATFTVQAAGSDLTYRWQYRTSSTGTWTNSSATGCKTDTLKVSGTTGRSGYQFRCKITDGDGNVTYSKAVYLYVLGVTGQPSTQKIKVGQDATFTVKATGYQKTYQWQYRTGSAGTWKNSSSTGCKTNTLTVSGTTGRSGYQFRCKITDGDGNVTYSKAVYLYVLGVTGQPSTQKIKADQDATFTVKATGYRKTYQWQYRTGDTGSWKNSGSTGNQTNTLTVTGTAGRSGYQFRCKITDGAGNVTYTKAVYLYVLGIKTQPASQKVKAGENAVFTVKATGYKKTYQWQYRTDSTESWKNSGATGNKTNSLTVAGTLARNGYQFRCKITDGAGNVTYTKAVYLYVLGIKTQPVSLTVKAGENAVFTVRASGYQKTYQWQYRTGDTDSWKKSGSTGNQTDSLTVAGTTGRDGYQFRCKITDGAGNVVYTDAVTLNVHAVVTEETVYIGNVNSMKVHLHTCGSLPAEENQVAFDSLEEALEKGYTCCGNCLA